jgi:hypothetical protein
MRNRQSQTQIEGISAMESLYQRLVRRSRIEIPMIWDGPSYYQKDYPCGPF